MKYKYEFKLLTLANGKKRLAIRLPESIKLISTFLPSDIQKGGSAYTWVTEKMDMVLSGESKYEEIQGNVCRLKIERDFTMVIDTLNPETEVNFCYIETNELRELIDIWVSENQKFNNHS